MQGVNVAGTVFERGQRVGLHDHGAFALIQSRVSASRIDSQTSQALDAGTPPLPKDNTESVSSGKREIFPAWLSVFSTNGPFPQEWSADLL